MRELRQGLAKDGMAYFALEQAAGKGQREKHWQSNPGENLIMSMVVDCRAFSLGDQFMFSAAVALACHDLWASHAGEETCIKWPNDLFWRDRKAGGILIENSIRGNVWEYAIVGVGININQTLFPEMGRKPVSLKQVTGKTLDPIELAQLLCAGIKQRIAMLHQHSNSKLLEEYNEKLYLKGQKAGLRASGQSFEARIGKVDASGRLSVFNNVEQSFGSGELEWIS